MIFRGLLAAFVLIDNKACGHPTKHGCSAGAPSATTRNGTLCGKRFDSFHQDGFLGVPFAQAPLHDLRLRHPKAYDSKYQGYDATSQPASCPGYAGFDVGIGPLDEDCLYLNIIRPTGISPHAKLPVVTWIYGGGFDAGGIADERYNMSYLVAQSMLSGNPIIAVAANYRVGGWGFLASREIVTDGAANIGLYDQRMAMQWIHENIGAFGGDPEKVAIWGESAGAFSVGYHLTAFNGNSKGLFRAAIMNSGTALGSGLQNTSQIEEPGGYQELYDNVTATVGCVNTANSLQCLRSVPYEDLFDAFKPFVFTPIIDGTFITKPPSESFAAGDVASAAVLLGSNTDEGTASFWGPRGTLNTTDDVASFIGTLNGGRLNGTLHIQEILNLYPDDPAQGCPYNTGEERFSDQGYMYKRGAAIAGDIFVHAGRRATAEYFAEVNGKKQMPVYSYRFDQSPWNGKEELIATVAPVYSTHYVELSFVFNNPNQSLSNWIGPDPAYHDLSTLMSRSWVSFVSNLDPNHHGVRDAAYWPPYVKKEPANMVFRTSDNMGGSFAEKDDWRLEQLKWWNENWDLLRN